MKVKLLKVDIDSEKESRSNKWKVKSLTSEWETKNLTNKWEAMIIRALASKCVQIGCEEISGKKESEAAAVELKEITAKLTDFLMSNALNPEQRLEVSKKAGEVSLGKFFDGKLESPDFSQVKVRIAQESIDIASIMAKGLFLKPPVKPLPSKASLIRPALKLN